MLLPPPRSDTVGGRIATRNYTVDPYVGYDESDRIGIGRNDLPEHGSRLHPKARVIGIAESGEAKAYPLDAVRESGPVNDEVGGLPVVVAVASDGVTLVAYVRRVEGTTLRFERASGTHLRGGGSRFDIATGRAIDGPFEGTTLPAAGGSRMFWFAWLDFHPETRVYGDDR